MAKNIVVCADGTWNRPTVHTNVDRLFNVLPGEPNAVAKTEAIDAFLYRNTPEQVAFYLEGVGAKVSRNDPLAGATGTGLHGKVLDGYLLLSRAYQPGDKLFLFGFSRGAYTVRSLAALIAKVGLLPPELAMQTGCRQLANQRWWAFKHQNARLEPTAPDAAEACPIRLVGVWDTVGALGVPFFNGIDAMDDLERHIFDFADLDLSERVAYGLHAMAIDEKRKDFVPSPWNPRHGVTQLWFPGVHSDVGGGYPFKGLADISFDWMLREAGTPEVGLRLEAVSGLAPDPLADRHESADSLVWALRSAPRDIPDDARLHPCVRERFAGRPDYRPASLAHHPEVASFYTGVPVAEKLNTADPVTAIRTLPAKTSMTVRALAEKWWNGTGLAVHPGETYAIEAKGTWSDASHACDATGWDGLAWMAGLRRVPEKNWFYLCLAVSADPLLECKNAGFFQGLFGAVAQIDKASAIIPVGCAQTITISRPGLAYFFANDAPTHYGNNLGYLDVSITRIA